MIKLQTERLALVPLEPDLLNLCSRNWQEMEAALGLEVTGHQPGETLQRAIAIKLEKMAPDLENYEWYTYWLVILRPENRAIGTFGFKGAPNEEGETEIGYGMQPGYQGEGYMTEAAQAVLDWAAGQMRELTVIAETAQTNHSSHRVLEKLGFEKFRQSGTSYWWRRALGNTNHQPKNEEG